MKIIDHRLHQDDGTPVTFKASPNIGDAVKPEYIVIHYTAGGNAKGAVGWLCNPASKVSAHLVIGRDGSVTQLVPFDRVAWHAGISQWEGRTGLNAYSIGIELDNAGRLVRKEDGWMAAFGGTLSVQPGDASCSQARRSSVWMAYLPGSTTGGAVGSLPGALRHLPYAGCCWTR